MFRQVLLPMTSAVRKCFADSVLLNSAVTTRNSGAFVPAVTPISSAIHTSSAVLLGRRLRKDTNSKFVEKSSTTDGENASIVEMFRSGWDTTRYPDVNLPTKIFNGIMFKDLPIVNIKATMNNTIFNLTDTDGVTRMIRACGYDGFKNARRGTNVAAQATGFTFGKKMAQRGYRTVRVRVQGLGAGRLASLKGITLAGVQIVSLTDHTPVSWNPPRARKQRRV